jgi:tripeptide aminopeptidase
MKTVQERFLEYVKYDTESDTKTGLTPSTPGQMVFAKVLVKELEELGMSDVSLDDNGYVMACLPSNSKKDIPSIGFISHMDTSPDLSGKNVNPRIVENYRGDDIVLNKEKKIILKTEENPEILKYTGQNIIVTDGNTLLGADDKAGLAEIMTAMEYLIANPEIEHGKVCVGFTPEEEIGQGADHFDVKKFGADFAYTLDGGEIGELQYENFNAAFAKITFQGRNVHPGHAKDKMINSIHIATEFVNSLPAREVPEKTSGYNGFFHLIASTGTVEESVLEYIIRDFDKDKFEWRKNVVENVVRELTRKYKQDINLEMRDQYYNMAEKIEPVSYIIDIAQNAMRASDVKSKIIPIRGGTDGARLSFMGLPTPNIFTGGHNFHGRFEYVPIQSMEKAVDVIVNIVKQVSISK